MEVDWDGGVGAWNATSPPQRDLGSLTPVPSDDEAPAPITGPSFLSKATPREGDGSGPAQRPEEGGGGVAKVRRTPAEPTRETADRDAFWRLISDDGTAISADDYCRAHVLMQHAWSPRTFSVESAARAAAADWTADARAANTLDRDRCLRHDSALMALGFAVHRGSFTRILRKIAVRHRSGHKRKQGRKGRSTWRRLRTHEELDASHAPQLPLPPPPPPTPPRTPTPGEEVADVSVRLQRFSPIAIKPASLQRNASSAAAGRASNLVLPLRKPIPRRDHNRGGSGGRGGRVSNNHHDLQQLQLQRQHQYKSDPDYDPLPPRPPPKFLVAKRAMPLTTPALKPSPRPLNLPVRAATSPSIPASARTIPIAPDVVPSPRSPRLGAPTGERRTRRALTDRSTDRHRYFDRRCMRDHSHSHSHAVPPAPPASTDTGEEDEGAMGGRFCPDGWVVRGSAKEPHARGWVPHASAAEPSFLPALSAPSPRARRVQWWKKRATTGVR